MIRIDNRTLTDLEFPSVQAECDSLAARSGFLLLREDGIGVEDILRLRVEEAERGREESHLAVMSYVDRDIFSDLLVEGCGRLRTLRANLGIEFTPFFIRGIRDFLDFGDHALGLLAVLLRRIDSRLEDRSAQDVGAVGFDIFENFDVVGDLLE